MDTRFVNADTNKLVFGVQCRYSNIARLLLFLMMSRGTLDRCSRNPGLRGTPVENHWFRWCM